MPSNLLGRNPADHCRADTGCTPERPFEVSTTNPGNSSVSAPNPYRSQEPMLGRPLMLEPEFMKAWAGSWLICSVCIERTMQISSAMPPMFGKSFEISWPDWPQFWNSQNGPRAFNSVFCNCASCWPLVKDCGNGLSWSSLSFGL